jgi:short-subunit dehydrogenase
VGELPIENWHWIININLYGGIYGCHTMIDWMKRNPRGAQIVNIASMAAIVSAPGMAPYNVTKAGMLSLSETLRGELAQHKISVTGVCPSFFPTNILASGRFNTPDERQVANVMMSHAHVSAEEVARRIMRGIERKQLYVFAPGVAGLFWRLKRIMPKSLLRFVARSYHTRLAAAANRT